MRDVVVRGLRDDDVAAVVALALRAWQPVFASFEQQLGPRLFHRLYPDWRTHQADAVRQALAEHEAWVATADRTPVGFATIVYTEQEASAEIYMIAVDPSYQRRGIGARLTEHALDRMRHRGITLATIGTGGDPGHGPARQTYERAGFTGFPQMLYLKILTPEDTD